MNEIHKITSNTPAKYFGHFLGPHDHLESYYSKSSYQAPWAEIAAIVYVPTFHTTLEVWCARIHAPEYLESDTFVMDDSPERVIRRAAHFVTGLDLGLMEIAKGLGAVNKRAI